MPKTTTRLMIYNVAYGTGSPGGALGRMFTGHRYLRTSSKHLERLVDFVEAVDPDVLGLIEVDIGSGRTGRVDQVELIANRLRRHYRCSVKYGEESMGRDVPILRHQANAILTRDEVVSSDFHYFKVGFKRLIIEVDVNGVRFFLVHLALSHRVRAKQLEALADIASGDGPVVVAGDFNTMRGSRELDFLKKALGLDSANVESLPTYPSWKPKQELDFVLHSKEINIERFFLPDVHFSDHLPLVVDFSR